MLVTSLILQRLDYCNSVLAELPAPSIKPLQRVQNAAARLVLNLDYRAHITPALQVTLATSSLQNTVQDHHTDAPHLQQYRSNLPL